jgi:hypothetical protein
MSNAGHNYIYVGFDRWHFFCHRLRQRMLTSVEAVSAAPDHLAGLAHIAELLGKFQQPDFSADDLLFGGYGGVSNPPRRGATLSHSCAFARYPSAFLMAAATSLTASAAARLLKLDGSRMVSMTSCCMSVP